ncbi:hypothetical protein [Pseudomonas turukhanskensis]|uniref:Uncharacterized protein n=1 Tax=Pseudomonas turukhanskensis TaxID=1806536 RepID=A0A9W6NDY1_9PSED|nr:hypothetical protein [Pseudomonas turukhanskensis]GLK88089.1 hypothetical protein GCM10017655_11510 [Pseudomonas turukhanskensis]
MSLPSNVEFASPLRRAVKSLGLALITLMALAALQPEVPAYLYDLLLVAERALLYSF